MVSFYSVNLFGGEDTRVVSFFYKRLFGWKSGIESEGHSELFTEEGIRIVFSKRKPGCNVEPGTITLEGNESLRQSLSELKEEWEDTNSTQAKQKEYTAYLDPWGNRIWIYWKPNL